MQPSARRSNSPSVQLQAICISCDWMVAPAWSESSISSTNGLPGRSWLITSCRSTSSPVPASRTGALASRSSGVRLAAGTKTSSASGYAAGRWLKKVAVLPMPCSPKIWPVCPMSIIASMNDSSRETPVQPSGRSG